MGPSRLRSVSYRSVQRPLKGPGLGAGWGRRRCCNCKCHPVLSWGVPAGWAASLPRGRITIQRSAGQPALVATRTPIEQGLSPAGRQTQRGRGDEGGYTPPWSSRGSLGALGQSVPLPHTAPWMGLCLPSPRAQAEGGRPSLETGSWFPASLGALSNTEGVRNCPEVETAQTCSAVVKKAHYVSPLLPTLMSTLGPGLEVS